MMSWKSKRLSRVAVAGIAAFSLVGLAGCAAESTGGSSPDEPVELTFALWQPTDVPFFEQVFADFTEENPNITVRIQQTGFFQYFPKLQNDAINGTLPDVFQLTPQELPLYASGGQLATIEGNDDDSVYADQWAWNGERYGNAIVRDTQIIWYNKDLFDAAGLEYPTADWTWDDFRSYASALTDEANDVYGVPIVLSRAGDRSFASFIAQAGGTMISEDETTSGFDLPETQEAIEFWQQIAADGSSPTQAQLAQTNPNALFTSGKLGMLPQRDGLAPVLFESELFQSGSMGVITLPNGPEGNMASTISVGNVVAANGDNVEAARLLVEFLGTREVADQYAQTGAGFTPYPESDQFMVDFYSEFIDLSPALEAGENAFPFWRSLNSEAWFQIVQEELTPVMDELADVEEATNRIAERMNAALAEERPNR